MDTRQALEALGLPPDATFDEARAAYRRLVRAAHPDLVRGEGEGPAATARTARLTQAYAVLRTVADSLGPAPAGRSAPRQQERPQPEPARREPTHREPTPYEAAVAAELAGGATLLVQAPAAEAFAAVLEAAGQVGDVAYVDRQLGIVEAIVRVVGGPSCSLLVTLQPARGGTEAFCTLESLEATPTPAPGPVFEAFVAALSHPG